MNGVSGRNLLDLVLAHCQKHNFLTPVLFEGRVSGFRYGPLGAELKQNLLREWWASLISSEEVNVFPVSTPLGVHGQKTNGQETLKRESLSSGTLGHYPEVLQLNGGKIPFGLAQSGLCIRSRADDASEMCISEYQFRHPGKHLSNKDCGEDRFDSDLKIWDPMEWTSLNIMFFCPPKMSAFWFSYWQRKQLFWWKNFATVLSKFSPIDIAEDGKQQMAVQFSFPWGSNTVDAVVNRGRVPLENLSEETGVKCLARDGRRSVIPHVIECEGNLDLAVLAYLFDAFALKDIGSGHMRKVLQLHHRLAPYKVSIVSSGSSPDSSAKLQDMAEYLSKDLKKAGISLMPNSDLGTQATLESQFMRFDEMGIPYIVILNETTLKNGTAKLRNRNTTLKESLIVTNVRSKLQGYLRMKSDVNATDNKENVPSE